MTKTWLNNALKFHYPAPVPYGKQEHCDCERVQLMASHIPYPVLPLPSTMTRPRDPAAKWPLMTMIYWNVASCRGSITGRSVSRGLNGIMDSKPLTLHILIIIHLIQSYNCKTGACNACMSIERGFWSVWFLHEARSGSSEVQASSECHFGHWLVMAMPRGKETETNQTLCKV